jgi:hypothetical protein
MAIAYAGILSTCTTVVQSVVRGLLPDSKKHHNLRSCNQLRL